MMSPEGNSHDRRAYARLRLLARQARRRMDMRLLDDAYRIVLLVSAAVLVDLVFPGSSAPDLPVLEEGMVAGSDVIAPISFPVYKSEAELARERAEAAGAVSPIFDLQPEYADSAIARSRAFFDSLAAALSGLTGEEERRQAVEAVLERYRIPPSEERVSLLASDEERERLGAMVERAFDELLRRGAVSNSDLGAAGSGAAIVRSEGRERLVPGDSLTTMKQFYERAAASVPSGAGGEEHRLYQYLVIRFGEPTVRLNREATRAAQDQARLAVDSVKYEVLEGERIVAAHERVGTAEIEKLRALQAAQAARAGPSARQAWDAHLGDFLYNVLLLAVFGLVLRYFRRSVYEDRRALALLWMLILAVAGAAGLIARAGWPPQLVPVAFAALVIATLWDGLLALVAIFVVAALVASRPPLTGVLVFFPAVIGGAAAALSGRVVRQRAHMWTFAAVIAAAYVLAAVSVGLIFHLGLDTVAGASLWGTVNGVASALLATGVIPLGESFTGITTDQTLLELADLNRPLLRRLSLEAPGTYAHSINVANLAEAAAREIGANSLLVRVGVYYHDIGKVKRPQFFVENQPRGRNPHDKLKPANSASIVREHVREGLELADEARLPRVVKAFIPEHHGTQQIGFFLDKAKELDPDAEIDPVDFRYQGPRPQSKETAIVLLADSVESAARVLQDPTVENIRALVDRIVDMKLAERQLDEAPLTLREISVIKEQFVKVLSGMYHSRLDYPIHNHRSAEGGKRSAENA